MDFKIHFNSLFVEPNLSEIDPKRLLVYQIDIRCMTNKDFESYLDKYYSDKKTIDSIVKNYELKNPTKKQINQLVTSCKKEELEEFKTLCYDLLDYKTVDNVYSMGLEEKSWSRYKNSLKWGSVLGVHHMLIGNKANAIINFMLLILLAFYAYSAYTHDVVSTGLALAFTISLLYFVTRTVWFVWLTSRYNVGEILYFSLKSRFKWGIANSLVTLDATVLVISLVLYVVI